MTFVPKTDWKDGDKVAATDFNRIEQGVADASTPAWNDITGKPTTFAPIIGKTATTAMAGNTVIPEQATWANISGKPAVIAAGADAAAARAAIGAGTSSLALGTTATTAKAGNYTPPNVTTSVNGLMLATDKVKLDSLTGKTITPVAAPEIVVTDPADNENIQAQFDALIASLKTAGVLI